MKLTVQRKHLIEVLNKCVPITKQKSPHAALQCVRLRASMLLEADATNLLHYISTRTVAVVDAPGEVLTNCADLLARVKTMAEGPIALSADGEKLRVASGKRKHALQSLNAAEFPGVAPTLPSQWLELPAGAFTGLLGNVIHATGTDADRPAINALFIEFGGGKLSATTTDARRLAYDVIDAGSGSDMWLLPLGAAEALLAAIGEGPTMVGIAGDQLQVSCGEVLFASRLVAEQYPPIRDNFMGIDRNNAAVKRSELVDAVSSLALADPLGNVKFSVSNGSLKLAASGNGEATDELDVVYEGRDVEVHLAPGYVLDALKSIDGDVVNLSITGDLDPVFVAQPDAAGFRLIMPCRPG